MSEEGANVRRLKLSPRESPATQLLQQRRSPEMRLCESFVVAQGPLA